jgi:predicted DNA-binding protein (MmcQ/YjbR family)
VSPVTADDVRRLVAALPGAEERAHNGHPDFRVGGRIFASLFPEKGSSGLRLTREEAVAIAADRPQAFRLVSDRGAVGWLSAVLDQVSEAEYEGLLEEAWPLLATEGHLAARRAATGRS